MKSSIRSVILTLSFLSITLSHPLSLSTVIRPAGPGEIRGVWSLLEETTSNFTCPESIEHTTWRRPDHAFLLPHNTILVDGGRCESKSISRSLHLYQAFDYDREFVPRSDEIPELPEALIEAMAFVPNAKAWDVNRNLGERFLFGYESVSRVCNGQVVFEDGTTVWITRPRKGSVEIDGLETVMEPGMKYMLIAPQFKSGYCLYGANAPWPEQSVEATGEEEESESHGEGEDESHGEEEFLPTPSPSVDAPPPSEVSESPEATDESEPACFAAGAMVQTENGQKRMNEVIIGDSVHVGNGQFSEVFAFTHKDDIVWSSFVRIEFEGGQGLEATSGHMVYADGEVKRMGDVRVGDLMKNGDGYELRVQKTEKVTRRGLYNPQTLNGDIVVDDIWVTTFTQAVPLNTALALLAPVRAAFHVGVDLLGKSLYDHASAMRSVLRA